MRVTKEINGCQVTVSFVEKPREGVIEKVQSILSTAYSERVQNELMEMTDKNNVSENEGDK